METLIAATAILSPIGLIFTFIVPAAAIAVARSPQLSAARLVAGYDGALFALAILVTAACYMSPEEALSVWQIPPDRYWQELAEDVLVTYVVAAFATIVGISIVGLPVLTWLSTRGKATTPWLLLYAGGISAGVSVMLYAAMYGSANVTLPEVLAVLVVTHVVSATGFGLAARLPWTLQSTTSVVFPPRG